MAINYFEYAKKGQVFHAANTANATLSALSTTATGFVLTNPYGSGVNIALLHVGGSHNTATAAAAVGIAMSPAVSATDVTHTTPLTVRGALLDGSAGASRGLADVAATTVGTPVFVRFMGGVIGSGTSFSSYDMDVQGALIIPAGASIQLAYVTTAVVGLFSMTWLEYKV